MNSVMWRFVLVAACWLAVAQGGAAKEYRRLGFDQLMAKEYSPVEPDNRKKKVVRDDAAYLEQFVLGEVLAMDGKAVEIAGYMLPISLRGDKVDEFLLMPDTGACCFGATPVFNGFVLAQSSDGVNLLDNVPIRIRGKLKVEEVWQSGFFSHLYSLDVEELVVGFGSTPGPSGPEIGL